MMVELRKFITMDNQEAVKLGDLEKTQESLPKVEPKFTTDVPEAVVREEADDQRKRRREPHRCRDIKS